MKAKSLWKTIRMYVISCILLVSLCVAGSFSFAMNSMLKKNAESSFQDLSDRLAQSAESLFRETELLALTMSRNPTLIEIMLRPDQYPLDQQYDDFFNLRAIQTNNSHYPQIDACRFIFRHHAFYVREGQQFLSTESEILQDLGQDILQIEKPQWRVSNGIIRYAQPVYNYLYSPKNIGLIVLEMSRAHLDEIFTNIQSLENARFELLFNGESLTVWGEEKNKDHRFLQRSVVFPSGFSLLFSAAGLAHAFSLGQALITTAPWVLIVCTIVFVLLRHIARKLYQTIAQLSTAIAAIDLQSDQMVQPTRYTELNNIVEHFNRMLVQIRRKFTEALQARDQERILSLQMLESQINPHFLYNSLDVINWLAWQEGAEDVAAMSRNLGAFYRDALSKTSNETSLEHELTHVQTYLDIMNYRVDEMPRVQIEIPEKLKNNVLPRLSLQPLLENAFQHGIPNRRNVPGRILLRAEKAENTLRITVRDDGLGMNAECLEKAISDLAVWPPVEMHGLVNIHHRIRLLYGEPFGLVLHSEENRYFEVEMHVPLRPFISQDSLVPDF